MRTTSSIRLSSEVRAVTVRGRDMREIMPAFPDLDRLRAQRAVERAIDEGIVDIVSEAHGRNKVLRQGIHALLSAWRNRQVFALTHADLGTSNTPPTEDDTGNTAHVDASPGTPRVPVTDASPPVGKSITFSAYATESEYPGSPTLREVCLCTSAAGVTAYNHALFDVPLSKQAGDPAIFYVVHTLNN